MTNDNGVHEFDSRSISDSRPSSFRFVRVAGRYSSFSLAGVFAGAAGGLAACRPGRLDARLLLGVAAHLLAQHARRRTPSTFTMIMHRMIQKAATPMVILVNRSPALVPNALWPPMPPKAPANPPPLPR